MGKPNFSEDFKRDAVHHIAVRGYAVREVSERLGVIAGCKAGGTTSPNELWSPGVRCNLRYRR